MRWWSNWFKQLVGFILATLVLTPALPFYFVKLAAESLAALMDWMVEGRAWVQPFADASLWVQRRFGIDAESEHEAWRERMRNAGKFE
jgi:hypothetical protein